MVGKCEFELEGYSVWLDFDKYRVFFSEEIPINVLERIQASDEYKFLYGCMISKFDYMYGTISSSCDEDRYNLLCKEFVDRYGMEE